MKLLADYDISVLYYLGKEKVVVDALNWKAVSMGNLEHFVVEERSLASEFSP